MEERVGKLERRVDVLTERLDTHDDWVSESRVFHKDMNTFKDTLTATQAAMREEQTRRHQQNAMKLNFIGVIVAVGTAVILALSAYVAYNQSRHAEVKPLVTQQQEQKQMASESKPQYIATE